MLLAFESSIHSPKIQPLNESKRAIDDDGAMTVTPTLSLTEAQPRVSSVSRMPMARQPGHSETEQKWVRRLDTLLGCWLYGLMPVTVFASV